MAEIPADISEFLKGFPDKALCAGTEYNGITGRRIALKEKVTVVITDKSSDHPMIEVNAPGASTSMTHFKIGNGFDGSLSRSGNYVYYYESQDNVLCYVPVRRGETSVDPDYVLRVRDAAGLSCFSGTKLSTTGHHELELGYCESVK
jgi:hypothetical protein